MPIDLVFVRHGQSESNLAKKLSQAGNHQEINKLRGRHTRSYRLTELGKQQAAQAGMYLNKNFGFFDRYYTSEYARAMETAGLLRLNMSDKRWLRDFFISERDWGDLSALPEDERQARFGEALRMKDIEPFFWTPPNGESLAQVGVRVDKMFGTLSRECSDMRVILVCHGEVMWVARILLERMSQQRFKELHDSNQKKDRISNGQILHYTRRNPRTHALEPYYTHLRIVQMDKDYGPVAYGFTEIERPSYSSEELLREVEEYDRMVA